MVAMPELPEIAVLAGQLAAAVTGLQVQDIRISQPKALNMPPESFAAALGGRTLLDARAKGKWILCDLGGTAMTDQPDQLAINLGMGGEIVLHERNSDFPGGKVAVRLELSDGRSLSIGFWWFGHVHLINGCRDSEHPAYNLGPGALDIGRLTFSALLRRHPISGIKSLLCNQKRLAGIGNVYNQDALWSARIHPLRKAGSLSALEIDALYDAMRHVLGQAIASGGSDHELNLYGVRGTYGRQHFQVAYRPGEPCPRCAMAIVKIRTGSTSSHVCPTCQPEP